MKQAKIFLKFYDTTHALNPLRLRPFSKCVCTKNIADPP